ncbi:MAG TPA: hypothetical protein VFT39_00585, partial [Vicinamibacterales bacterium]|nr:hypothetical protein [Vicinamibacterales bacterium]
MGKQAVARLQNLAFDELPVAFKRYRGGVNDAASNSRSYGGITVTATGRVMRSLGRWSVALLGFAIVSTASAIDLVLPNRSGSVKFVVLGDFGSGEPS